MSAHDKVLAKSKKDTSKYKVSNMNMQQGGKLNEKGKRAKKEYGAKNNDSEQY